MMRMGTLLLLALTAAAAQSQQPEPITRRIVSDLTAELKQQLARHKISVLLVLPGTTQLNNVSIRWDEVGQDLQRLEVLHSFADFSSHWHKGHSRSPPPAAAAVAGATQQHGGRGLLWLHRLRALLQHSSSSSHSHHQQQQQQQQQQQLSTGRASLRLLHQQLTGPLQQHLTGPIIDGKTLRQQRAQQQTQQAQQAPAPTPPEQQQQSPHHQQPRVKVAILTLAHEGAVGSGVSSLESAIMRRLRAAVVLSLTHSSHRDKPETLVAFDGEGWPVAVAVQESSVFRDAFTQIYAGKVWGADGGGSGLGSNLNYTTSVRRLLSDVLARYNISSMLDSSSGSMHWMPLVLSQHEARLGPGAGFKFMGTDVVCMLIDQHKQTFANHTNWDFKCIDYSAQPLPRGYELVFSRDSLQHVPMHGAWQFLNNVRASGAKYLLVGSYVNSTGPNVNIAGGAYYDIDLLKPPFNVSKPLEVFNENVPDGKHLLLFEVAKMTWADPLMGLV